MSTLADRLRRGQQRAFSASCSTLPSVDAATGSPSSLASAAVAALRMCGFVVLRSALSMPHVESLAAAYADLPELVTADLRDGRREQLLPFAAPFNDDALLHGELWTSVAAEYLGATALDLDAVTVVLARAALKRVDGIARLAWQALVERGIAKSRGRALQFARAGSGQEAGAIARCACACVIGCRALCA